MVKVETTIEHPLETVFNLSPKSTIMEKTVYGSPTSVVASEPATSSDGTPKYDEKDTSIESQLKTVYDIAMTAYEEQQEALISVEPKYKSRGAEVAAGFLNTALAAAKEQASLKQHKDKLAGAKEAGPKTVNQNLIVADRNTILKALLGQS